MIINVVQKCDIVPTVYELFDFYLSIQLLISFSLRILFSKLLIVRHRDSIVINLFRKYFFDVLLIRHLAQ